MKVNKYTAVAVIYAFLALLIIAVGMIILWNDNAQNMLALFILLLIFSGIFAGFTGFYLRKSKRSTWKTYEQITLGMPEEEMLSIMGGKYNRSLLRDGITMYEWIYSSGGMIGSAYMSNGIGFGSRTTIDGSKVDIVCRNGVVEEVRPYNC